MKALYRALPAIHELMQDKKIKYLAQNKNLESYEVKTILHESMDIVREQIRDGLYSSEDEVRQTLLDVVADRIRTRKDKKLRKVINATGVILHTNLGRATLSQASIEALVETASGYSNLEYNLQDGKRGSRHALLEDLLKELTGAEAAMIVNNNAAAVYFILRALAKDQEVIISRGELVEVGGSFRISSIMEESGAILKEVGTTNKTHLFDYKQAITEQTRILMKVHTSNFMIQGFTSAVEIEELFALKLQENKDLIVYADLGSGALYDFASHGIGNEPIAKDLIKQGVDLLSFSGDKLLGGPQAGIIVGKKSLIDQLKKHQLARVLRIDKLTYASLEATLRAYQSEEKMLDIPVVSKILQTETATLQRAKIFLEKLQSPFTAELISVQSPIGGGTMPGITLPSAAVALTHPHTSADEIAKKFRLQDPAIVFRIHHDQIIIDFRTVTDEEIDILLAAFSNGSLSES